MNNDKFDPETAEWLAKQERERAEIAERQRKEQSARLREARKLQESERPPKEQTDWATVSDDEFRKKIESYGVGSI